MDSIRTDIYNAIDQEREKQDDMWGRQHDNKNTANDWIAYICQQVSRASPYNMSRGAFESAMVKVAALAVAAIESSDRNGGPHPRHYDSYK